MRLRPFIFIGIILLLALQSCQWLSSIVHDEEVVAKLGKHKLYRSEVEAVIPKETHGEDSLNLAMLYINSWATDMAFQDVSEKELSKEEKDVTKELEQYKESLLRYRYEQRYINERLDTLVTDAQIYEYYKSHAESFKTPRALVKARTLEINKKSPVLASFKKLMCSDKVEDVIEADSLAKEGALKYSDYSYQWMDVVDLAAGIGVSYNEIKPCKKGAEIQFEDDNDNLVIVYLADVVGEGEVAPIEYVREKVKDSVISERKHELLNTLERELLEKARVNENFEIYSK
jgi:hypothetical protein